MISINFGNEIDCLVAKRDPVKIALYQPKGNLVTTDILGPHYNSEDKKNIIPKIKAFIENAVLYESKLIIFPEYGAPVEILDLIIKKQINIPQETLIILPLESLNIETYKKICEYDIVVDSMFPQKTPSANGYVNACAVIAMKETPSVYFQLKRYSSSLETGLSIGSNCFIFKGEGLALTVFMCSDANNLTVYQDQIKETCYTTGRYFIHVQCNPSSGHPIYNAFFQQVLSSNETDKNILITSNWASSSTIDVYGADREGIEIPYSCIACSGKGKRDSKYMTQDNCFVFKSFFENDRFGQIMNLVYPYDGAHILTIKRPYESLEHAATKREFFVSECNAFSYDKEFNCLENKWLSEEFVKSIEEKTDDNISSVMDKILEFTPEEKEIFVSSSLLEDKYRWLDKDILTRPIIWLTFYKSIVSNPVVADSIDIFIQVLRNLVKCNEAGYFPQTSEIKRYPINLNHQEEKKDAWVFHCRSLTASRATDRVIELLSDIMRYVNKGYRLTLFPIACRDGNLNKEKIIKASIEPKDPDPLMEDNNYNVKNPLAGIQLEVCQL